MGRSMLRPYEILSRNVDEKPTCPFWRMHSWNGGFSRLCKTGSRLKPPFQKPKVISSAAQHFRIFGFGITIGGAFTKRVNAPPKLFSRNMHGSYKNPSI